MSHKLQRIPIIVNKNYRASGTKSYVWLLNKWLFEPSLPGPYQLKKPGDHGHHGNHGHHRRHGHYGNHGHHGRHGQVHTQALVSEQGASLPVLSKKVEGATGQTGQTTEVTADDMQNDSLYLVGIQIGTPPQTLLLDFDTGSSDLWIWSTELSSAVKSAATSHHIFNPTKSSTFEKVTGSTWKISYGDESSASGDVGTDNVHVGGLTIKNQAIELSKNLSSQFIQGTGDGLLGLAWGSINTVVPHPVPTPVDNMITQNDIPKAAELFTVYLGSWRDASSPDKGESFYTFGYIDDTIVQQSGQPISYTPVDNSQGFWSVASESATVNGKAVQQPGNTAIMDTGTTLALVADSTCAAIYDAIPGSTYDQDSQGYIFPSNLTADQLPVVTFAIGDTQFTVQKEDLEFAQAKPGYSYGGIQSRGSMTFDILGDTVLKGIYAIFDQGNTRFGAVPRVRPDINLGNPPA